MKKIAAILVAGLFSFQAHATSVVQFDTKNNVWSSQLNLINGMSSIGAMTTVGPYTLAFGYPNLIAAHNGSQWNTPAAISNLSASPFTSWIQIMPKYPDTANSPAAWIFAQDSNTATFAYYNGTTVTAATSFPFIIDPQQHFFFEAHHVAWAVDYKSGRVFWTPDTKWYAINSLPAGKIISVTTDTSDDTIYALELDMSSNKYFVTHLLSNNQWAAPSYLSFSNPNDAALTDFMVTHNGNTMMWISKSLNDIHVLISQDNGKTIVDTGSIPHSDYRFFARFEYIYNGNKAHILYSILSHDPDHNLVYYDTVAYLDPSAKNPGWTQVTMPKPLALYPNYVNTYDYFWNSTGEDGTRLWLSGLTADTQLFEVYYFDIKSKTFVDTHFNNIGNIYYNLQACNQGQAFAIGTDFDTPTSHLMGFYFDGHTWKSTVWKDYIVQPLVPPVFSYRYRNNWRITANDPAGWFKPIVDETTRNIWIMTSPYTK